MSLTNSKKMAKIAVDAILDKKGEDVRVIDISGVSVIADYFVIASGTSSTHVKSLADNIEEELKKEKIYPNKIEGYDSGIWILMDYGEVIVHIFTQQERENYSLEDLWDKVKE